MKQHTFMLKISLSFVSLFIFCQDKLQFREYSWFLYKLKLKNMQKKKKKPKPEYASIPILPMTKPIPMEINS